MKKLRVAVVGLGKIAQIAHLPFLKKMEEVEIVAVCDVDEKKMSAILSKFKIPRWYNLFDEMIEKEEIDALHICTTNHYHYPMALMALQKGIPALIEKPIALNVADAERIAELSAKTKVPVVVGMHNRFRDDVQLLKEFLNEKELGDLFYLKAGWLKKWTRETLLTWETQKQYAGGGVLMDLGIQLIDMALYLLNKPVIRSVRMFGYNIKPQFEVEDSMLAVLETTDGMSMTFETSWNLHLDHDIQYQHLFGKNGSAYLNPLRIQKVLHGNLVTVTPIAEERVRDRYLRAYERQVRHFINVVKGEEENMSSARDAVETMRIIDALYRSMNEGKEIALG
ncbi:Gfo/Idh/MocA family protein [Calditrichota bacterium LG25]